MDIEVLENSPLYLKIAVKEGLSPLKITIHYKEVEYLKGLKPDLVMYSSFTNKEPSKEDYYRSTLNVRFFFDQK